jgi:hypothetical protein
MPANRKAPQRRHGRPLRRLPSSDSQSMRYLRRFPSAAEAIPVERAVAEVVCRLILFRKPMERGSDFLRLGASAAGGLMVWSEYVLDRMIDELQQKPRRRSRFDSADEDSSVHPLSDARPLAMVSSTASGWARTTCAQRTGGPGRTGGPVQRLVFTADQRLLPAQPPGPRHLAMGSPGGTVRPPCPIRSTPPIWPRVWGWTLRARLLELIGLCIEVPALLRALAAIEVGDFKHRPRPGRSVRVHGG